MMHWINRLIEIHILWRGINASGQLIQARHIGTLSSLRQQCKRDGTLITHHRLQILVRRRRHSRQLAIQFFIELGQLIDGSLSLIAAIELMQTRHQSDPLNPILTACQTALHQGHPLSSTLTQFPSHFTAMQCQLIYAAEQTHQLSAMLKQINAHMQFRLSIERQLKKALIYPLFVLAFSTLMTVGLLVFAIPQFQTIFSNFDASLPTATQLLITFSDWFSRNGLLTTLCTGLIIALYTLTCQCYPALARGTQSQLKRLPLLHSFRTRQHRLYWTQVMQLGLLAKLPFCDCLRMAQHTLPKQQRFTALIELNQSIQAGRPIAATLRSLNLLSELDLAFIETGAQSATLTESFKQIHTNTANELINQLERLSKWIEPVMMMILAAITGGLIISLYLPIFKIGSIL